MVLAETFYGHTQRVHAIAALHKDAAVTGGQDRLARHYRMDTGKLLSSMEPLLAAQGSPLDYPDVPFSVTAWFGIEGRRWHGGLSADLDQIAGLVQTFEDK
jgi:hypothetical protein